VSCRHGRPRAWRQPSQKSQLSGARAHPGDGLGRTRRRVEPNLNPDALRRLPALAVVLDDSRPGGIVDDTGRDLRHPRRGPLRCGSGRRARCEKYFVDYRISSYILRAAYSRKGKMQDLFNKLLAQRGPIGQHAQDSHGYFTFPKLEGPISNRMVFRGRERLIWSLNNYLGLANHPEVRRVDAEAAARYGFSTPMGARMMSGESDEHLQLEAELSELVHKEDTVLVNYGYQGMVSAIDCLLGRHDVVIYDAESHACILDGVRLHLGRKFAYPHNDVLALEDRLSKAHELLAGTSGSILVITEGVFGMSGVQGNLKEIVALKQKYSFRLLVDDAHGIGTMGERGAGTGEAQGVQDGIDIYFGTFAKSFAMIGGFLASEKQVTEYLRYNMRSQLFAKSLPMPMVVSARKRLELLRSHPELRDNLWRVSAALQQGLTAAGFDIGKTQSPITPVYLNGTIPEATYLTYDLREHFDIFCSVVVYPVVPKGTIILRLMPTAVHTLEDVDYTVNAFATIYDKFKAGDYRVDRIKAA
jgi:glycine C-acetyltransferase